MGKIAQNIEPFDIGRSIMNTSKNAQTEKKSYLITDGKEFSWNNQIERLNIIREGIPYEAIDVISKRLNYSIKSVLEIVGIPQTTYNKNKKEHLLLDSRHSELIILILELIEYGLEVFNNEPEKFIRWLGKPNLSLGGYTPESFLDTITGINEVKFSLNRLEYGNLA